MELTRRRLLGGATAMTAAAALSGCAERIGSRESYLTNVVEPSRNNVVFHWTDAALQSVRDQAKTPPVASRCIAMGSVAGFLAVNGIEQRYDTPYALGEGPRNADPEVAYAVAFALAAAEAFQQPFIIDRIRFLSQYPDGEAKSEAVRWGRQVAKFVVRDRTDDGAEPSEANFYLGRYARRQDALRWRPTGPFYRTSSGPAFRPTFDRGLVPGWGAQKPWTMKSSSQFRAEEFIDPRSPEFADQYAKVKALGAHNSTIRTADESEIAFFWEDGPWGITPPGHFTIFAMQLFQDRNMELVDLARAMALVTMVMADAAISTWDSKFYYDIIRPETAIRWRVADFGNTDPRMTPDEGWESLIPTPMFPTYTSGHSCFGASGAEMIALILGRDDIAFSGEAPDLVIWPEQLTGVRRYWTSLSHAAQENGDSRIYGGVHWDVDNDVGLRVGRDIARQAFTDTFPRKA